jgi:hypothetical protein
MLSEFGFMPINITKGRTPIERQYSNIQIPWYKVVKRLQDYAFDERELGHEITCQDYLHYSEKLKNQLQNGNIPRTYNIGY